MSWELIWHSDNVISCLPPPVCQSRRCASSKCPTGIVRKKTLICKSWHLLVSLIWGAIILILHQKQRSQVKSRWRTSKNKPDAAEEKTPQRKVKHSHNKKRPGSSCIYTSQITDNRWSKGLWEVLWGKHKVNKSEQAGKQEHPSSTLSETTRLISHFSCEGGDLSNAPTHLSDRHVADSEKERDGGGRERLTDGLCGPPTTLSFMYLAAAKTCVILMSSAFCNLTWEFKSCLGFASLTSAGSYVSRKEKGREKLVGL